MYLFTYLNAFIFVPLNWTINHIIIKVFKYFILALEPSVMSVLITVRVLYCQI